MKTKPQKICPPEFVVTVSDRVWAAQQVPGVDIDFETASMMDHDFKTAHSDWKRVWRNWMRSAYRTQNRYQPVKHHKPQLEIASAEMEKLKALRAFWGIGSFRDPYPGETVSDYRLAMDSARTERFAKPRQFSVVK
jgi:hypothetical protein